jgi:hypothetical protein
MIGPENFRAENFLGRIFLSVKILRSDFFWMRNFFVRKFLRLKIFCAKNFGKQRLCDRKNGGSDGLSAAFA